MKALVEIPENKRVWVDETGMDSDEIYPYGWALKGERCDAQKQGNRATRERIIWSRDSKKMRLSHR